MQRLQGAGTAPSASSGGWSRSVSPCSRVPAGQWTESRRGASAPGASSMNVFNREMKKRQKNWAASLENNHQYDYLRDEVGTPVQQYGRTLGPLLEKYDSQFYIPSIQKSSFLDFGREHSTTVTIKGTVRIKLSPCCVGRLAAGWQIGSTTSRGEFPMTGSGFSGVSVCPHTFHFPQVVSCRSGPRLWKKSHCRTSKQGSG